MVQEVLISTINNMRVFMKHEKYKTEEEYRAVLIVPEEIMIIMNFHMIISKVILRKRIQILRFLILMFHLI